MGVQKPSLVSRIWLHIFYRMLLLSKMSEAVCRATLYLFIPTERGGGLGQSALLRMLSNEHACLHVVHNQRPLMPPYASSQLAFHSCYRYQGVGVAASTGLSFSCFRLLSVLRPLPAAAICACFDTLLVSHLLFLVFI